MKNEIAIFKKYMDKYEIFKVIKSKKIHSYRVAKYAVEIAKSLNLNCNDIITVINASLLHDIGRVPQYYFYETFNDLKSKDHGDLGYELLLDNNYNNNTILNVVKNHNKYHISDDLSEKEKLFCNIIRDADKLDIMFTQGLNIIGDNYFLPDEVYYSFKKNKMVENQYECTDIISIIRMLGFIFDFNFCKSLEIINNEDLVSKKINIIYDKFNDPRLKDIENILKDYISNNIYYKEGEDYGRIRKKI